MGEFMNILFLDVDGVLNNHSHTVFTDTSKFARLSSVNQGVLMIDPWNVRNLRYSLERLPDVKMVLSSSWRNGWSIDEMVEIFNRVGIPSDRLIDKTPKCFSFGDSRRGEECREWMIDKEINNYVAVDDCYVFDSDDPHMLKTDPVVGFTFRDANLLIERFRPDWVKPIVLL